MKKPKTPKLNLAELRASLSECHIGSDDRRVKLYADVKNPEYFLDRIMECVQACQEGREVEENTRLGIQLFNIYRVKTCGPIQSKRKQKERSGSEDTAGDNQSPASGGMVGDGDTRE